MLLSVKRHHQIRSVIILAFVLVSGLLTAAYCGMLTLRPRNLHQNKYVDADGNIIRQFYSVVKDKQIGPSGIQHYTASIKNNLNSEPLRLWERLLLVGRLPLHELMVNNYGCVYDTLSHLLYRLRFSPDWSFAKSVETTEQQQMVDKYVQALVDANPGFDVSKNDFMLGGVYDAWKIRLFGHRLHDISPLRGFPNLRQLVLANCEVADLSVLSSFPELEYLILYNVPKVTDISTLASLANLSFLVLWNTDVTDLRPLRNLSKLSIVNLTGNKHLTDIAPLAGHSRHNIVGVYLEATKVKDVSPLAQCHSLLNVNLDGTPVEDISNLPPNVRCLTVANSEVRDISRLRALSQPTAFHFYNTPAYWRQLTCYIVIPGILIILAAAAITVRKLRQ